MAAQAGGPVTREIVLGVLSLIVWSLIIVVTLKYVADPAARRQQRRGRHALADGAGVPRARPAHAAGADARRDRRGDVLRRLADHAGDLGAVGGRRPEARDAGVRALRAADHRRHPGRAVRGAVARHRARSRRSSARSWWSGSSRSRSLGAHAHRRRSRRVRGDQSALCDQLRRRATARSGWSRSARCSSPSPAARRSMPISAISAASRSRRPGSASCCRRC